VPPVGYLGGLRCAGAGTVGVGTGPVPADDLHFGMGTQPLGEGFGVTAGQHVDWPVGGHVQQDRAVGVAAAQREVIHAQHGDLADVRLRHGA
jgi:hypothetical protein